MISTICFKAEYWSAAFIYNAELSFQYAVVMEDQYLVQWFVSADISVQLSILWLYNYYNHYYYYYFSVNTEKMMWY